MITVIYAYYDNPDMLKRHLAEWAGWPAGLKIIVVDDASPNAPAMPILKDAALPVPLELYRINENIPWNQNGARNLGMHAAGMAGWALMLDMDHLLPSRDAAALVAMPKDPGHYYVPRREWPHGAEHRRHPNSFLLEGSAFQACGGYDEDFCGFYGSDKVFRLALDTVADRIETNAFKTVLYEGIIEDANTREFGRKDSHFHSANHPHLVAKRRRAPYKAENPLRFTWERLI